MSEEVAQELDAKRGDVITIATTKGEQPFEIEAIYVSPPGPPEVSIGIADAKKYFSAREPFAYIADVKEGQDPTVVAERVEDAFPGALHTETADVVKQEAQTQVGTYFQIVYAILAIAAIVGLLGLANTLAMSVLHRFREIGILRAIGVTRSQTWRMVLVESLTMGLTAFVLSMPLGWLLTYLVVTASGRRVRVLDADDLSLGVDPDRRVVRFGHRAHRRDRTGTPRIEAARRVRLAVRVIGRCR